MSDQYPSYPGPSENPNQGRQPPPYGQQPPGYGQQPYGQPPAYGQQPIGYGGPVPPYASWWSRVGANIINGLIAAVITLILLIPGLIVAFKDAEIDLVTGDITNVYGAGVALIVVGVLVGIAFQIWNWGVRQGKVGQSIGKSALHIQVVRGADGRYLGVGFGILRWFMYYLFTNVCFLDVLWPLWDPRKRTWHDMVVSSIVIRKP